MFKTDLLTTHVPLAFLISRFIVTGKVGQTGGSITLQNVITFASSVMPQRVNDFRPMPTIGGDGNAEQRVKFKSTVYEDFKDILSPACRTQKTLSSHLAPQSTPSPPPQRSEQSLRSRRSDVTTSSSSTNSSKRIETAEHEEVDITRFTAPPKCEPLFQYIDWDGNPRKKRVHGPPPVSFNRYIPYGERPRRATTNVVVNPRTGERLSPHRDTKPNNTSSYFDWANGLLEAPEREPLVFRASAVANNERASKYVDEARRESGEQQSIAKLVRQDSPALEGGLAGDSSPRSTSTHSEVDTDLCSDIDAVISMYQDRLSGGSTETTSSVHTDKLPSVTNPQGIAAYYGRYLEAALSLTNSRRTSRSSASPTPSSGASPQSQASRPQHAGTKLYVFPPNANKPLPPIPTPHGSAVSAKFWAVAAVTELSRSARKLEKQTSTNEATFGSAKSYRPSTAPAGVGLGNTQVSCWSDSEDEDDDSKAKVREIDHKAFGRGKTMHMRPGCEGWDEYRNRRLEESRTPKKSTSGGPKPRRTSLIRRGMRKLSLG